MKRDIHLMDEVSTLVINSQVKKWKRSERVFSEEDEDEYSDWLAVWWHNIREATISVKITEYFIFVGCFRERIKRITKEYISAIRSIVGVSKITNRRRWKGSSPLLSSNVLQGSSKGFFCNILSLKVPVLMRVFLHLSHLFRDACCAVIIRMTI